MDTGLTLADAPALVQRRLDVEFAREAQQLEAALIDDGLDGFVIDAFLDDHHDKFVAWRRLLESESPGRSPGLSIRAD